MIRYLLLALLTAPVWLLGGCAIARSTGAVADVPEAAYRKITPQQAKEILGGDEPYILLDVRTRGEYREARIEGAVLIPDTELGERAEEELPDKDAQILVYCRSGRRSAGAAQMLANMGYTNVLDFGGIIDWPYDTVSG